MTRGQIAGLVLGSAVVASLISAIVAAVAGYFTKRLELKASEDRRISEVREERLRLAVEMAKMRLDSTRMIAELSADSSRLEVNDPAELVCVYQEALAAIGDKGATFEIVLEAMKARSGQFGRGAGGR